MISPYFSKIYKSTQKKNNDYQRRQRIRQPSKKPSRRGRRSGADENDDDVHGWRSQFLAIFLMIAVRAHDSGGDEQTDTMARTSTSTASGSRSPWRDLLRPLQLRSPRRDSSQPPPNRDLHYEIRRNVDAKDRNAGTIPIHVSVLFLASSPSLSWFPANRERDTDREKGDRYSKDILEFYCYYLPSLCYLVIILYILL